MLLIRLTLVIFIMGSRYIFTSSTPYMWLPKCCEEGSGFVKQNNSFICNQSENQRILIQTNFFVNINYTADTECVESVNLDLFLFRKTLNETEAVKELSDTMFPKCCPMDYLYNPITHSCAKAKEGQILYSNFFKVGLLNCEIIYDYFYENISDIGIGDNKEYISRWGDIIDSGKYCVDEILNHTYVVRVCEKYDICDKVLCLHKCCPDGQSFVNGSHCKDTYIYGIDLTRFSHVISNINAEYALIHGYKTKVYIPVVNNYHIDDGGNFHTSQEKMGNEVYTPEEETYCIEHATKGGRVFGYTLFRIIPETGYIEKKFLFNRWAMVISNIFLIITVSYYTFSNETRKVFGKTLISFCTALFLLFSILIYCTFNPNLNARRTLTTCKSIGFLLIYLSFSSFVWLQVMCYDIYWTFGSSKRYSSFTNKKRRDLKRFIYYSLYGWGVPLLVTLILVIFHFVDIFPPPIKIKMGETKCLIERGEDNYAEILFYIIPLTIIQSVNVIFFIMTVRYCLQVKGNIQKMNQSVDLQKKKNKFQARKERFSLVAKLSFVMGFFYLFEVISSFYDFKKNAVTEYIEIIWDFMNCVQGVFIFVIFICKIKYFKMCRRQVTIDKIRKISLTANSTRTTGLSSTRKSSRESKRKYSKEEERNKFG